MTAEGWITLGLVAFILFALIRNLAPPDLLFLGTTALLALLGVISPKEAFAGFSNPGMLTVAALFVVAAGLRETGVLEHVGRRILGRAKTENSVMTRLAGVVVPLSAFLNNTPIVAMFIPVVMDWCRRNQVSPSKLLIPLSFLTILGGTCTLIGTSTNLVVSGLMIDSDPKQFPGIQDGIDLFELAPVGVPYAVVGFFYLLFFGRWLLPERKELLEQLGEARREYLVEVLVQPTCPLIGRTVEDAGLRQLPGLFLIEIDRNGELIGPVRPDETLEANDRLVFTGVVSSIIELEKTPGIVPAADPSYEVAPHQQRRRRLCEAVISANSPLIGETIRDADFRAAYGAAVVAVHRSGARVEKKVGDIRLRPGDTLLLQTGPHFLRAHRNDPAFYLVSDVQEWRPLRYDRAWLATLMFLILLVLMTTGVTDTLTASALIAVMMIAVGCLSAGEARNSIEWQVLITIAASFGVGTALEKSGAATAVAETIFESTKAWGPLAALICITIVTSVLTEMITNNAAAVLMFPFCLQTAELYDVSSRPFLIGLVMAASASFMTPIGYQTNLMVYGPGGYRFADFLLVGGPLKLVLTIVAVVLIPLVWPFRPL